MWVCMRAELFSFFMLPGHIHLQSSSVDKKMMERERNRRQARKSRTLKKQCTERLQQELNLLRKNKV